MISTPPSRSPSSIVAVIGTTGVGKSQLAVSLAQSLSTMSTSFTRAQILSADSMQLYNGLDVITNKVTEEEMGGIEHWGLNLVQPGQGGSWELGKWCSEADRKISSMPDNELPIICGGTHYFIQHFLFPPRELSFARPTREGCEATSTEREEKKVDPLATRWTPPCPKPNATLDPEMDKLLDTFWTNNPIWPHDVVAERDSPKPGPSQRSRPIAEDDKQLLAIWKLLEAVDPQEAGRWHWRDGRKVRRGLERWWEHQCGKNEKSEGRNNGEGESDNRRKARFRTLIFWVYESMENLRPRLDKRVDRMVENGLLSEIAELRSIAEQMYGSPDVVDHTEGIFQSIGYKEFSALSLRQDDPASDPLFPAMLDRTKLSTYQYAKSQLKWIKRQLLPAVREAKAVGGDVQVYVVPGGEAGEPLAKEVLQRFLKGEECPDPKIVGHRDAATLLSILDEADTKVPDTAERQVLNLRQICKVCSTPGQPFSVTAKDWDEHLKSKIHRRSMMNGISKEERIAAAKMMGEAKRLEREKDKEEKKRDEPDESKPAL